MWTSSRISRHTKADTRKPNGGLVRPIMLAFARAPVAGQGNGRGHQFGVKTGRYMSRFSGWYRFTDIPKAALQERAGVYEVRFGRISLKVGIAGNLWKRLNQHRKSRGLKGPLSKPWKDPSQVRSKSSILAKHLYFDSALAPQTNLRDEATRQKFISTRCKVRWQIHPSRKSAREKEIELELKRQYRYQGRVRRRTGAGDQG